MTVVTFRVDPDVDRAIDYLVQRTGDTKSKIVRDAVLNAERQARREAIRREALELGSDETDQAEVAAVRAFMGGDDAW